MGLLTPEMAAPLTARVSALVFAAALIAPSLSPWAARRSAGLFQTFIAAHTVHFSAVAWLALVSGGKNLPASGGWPLVLIEAVLFYVLAWTALRARRAGRDASRRLRRADVAATAIVALIFLGAYVPRTVRSAWFAVPAGLIGAGLAAFILRHRNISPLH